MSHCDVPGRPYNNTGSLFVGLSPRRPVFDSRRVHVGILVDRVSPGQASLEKLRFCPVNIILQILYIQIELIYHQRYDIGNR
jgi:hypothetical protein